MSPDLSAARQLFFDYACSHFFMWHDGVLDAYRQMGPSEADEQVWRAEYIVYWVNHLSLDDLTAVNRLRDAQAGEALAELMKLAGQGDGYAQLWYANAVWELAGSTNAPAELTTQVKQLALSIWQRLVTESFSLTEAHRADILPHLAAFEAVSAEAYVQKYALRQYEHWRGI